MSLKTLFRHIFDSFFTENKYLTLGKRFLTTNSETYKQKVCFLKFTYGQFWPQKTSAATFKKIFPLSRVFFRKENKSYSLQILMPM